MKKIYVGKRLEEGCEVYVRTEDGKTYPLAACNAVRNHSPDGFEWGYSGSGPAQLALAILADHCGPMACPERCPWCGEHMHNSKCPECLYDWKADDGGGEWNHIMSGSHGYQGFKFQIIAKLPHDGFELTSDEVAAWVITKMAQQLSPDAQRKIEKLDAEFSDGSGMIALSLLRQVHEVFPLSQAGMGHQFDGTHSLQLSADGRLVLFLWWEGHGWPITFTFTPEATEPHG